jgi:hypothetical protein
MGSDLSVAGHCKLVTLASVLWNFGVRRKHAATGGRRGHRRRGRRARRPRDSPRAPQVTHARSIICQTVSVSTLLLSPPASSLPWRRCEPRSAEKSDPRVRELVRRRKGVRSLVLESSPALRTAGFAFTACKNAFRALDALGLGVGDKIREQNLQAQAYVPPLLLCRAPVAAGFSGQFTRPCVCCCARRLRVTSFVYRGSRAGTGPDGAGEPVRLQSPPQITHSALDSSAD